MAEVLLDLWARLPWWEKLFFGVTGAWFLFRIVKLVMVARTRWKVRQEEDFERRRF